MSRLKEVMEPNEKKEKAKLFRLTARANALRPEKVKILTEIFKELQNKDLIDLQTVKEIIKNTELKIKF